MPTTTPAPTTTQATTAQVNQSMSLCDVDQIVGMCTGKIKMDGNVPASMRAQVKQVCKSDQALELMCPGKSAQIKAQIAREGGVKVGGLGLPAILGIAAGCVLFLATVVGFYMNRKGGKKKRK